MRRNRTYKTTQRPAASAANELADVAYSSGPVAFVTEYDPRDFSDPGNPAIHIRIRDDRDTLTELTPFINTYRAYARGKHRITLTDKQKETLRNLLANRFCDNVCGQVLRASSSRLSVERLQCEDEATQKWLEDWFVSSDLKSKCRKVHYAALRDGNTVLALSWSGDKQRVCIYPEEWWNGSEGVFVAYDTEGEMLYGVKEWKVRTTGVNGWSGIATRRNIWFPDRLERWQGNGTETGWKPYQLKSDNGQWPMPWTGDNNEPLGVPYVHFANAGDGDFLYGGSDISEAVGWNDQLNDLQYGMTAAGRKTAYQTLFASGVKDTDESGKKIVLDMFPGQLFTAPDPAARMTAIQAGDLSQLIALYDKKQATVAIRTRTPMYEINNEAPSSGEALYQAQQPAIDKATENIDRWTPRWTQVAYLAVSIYNAYADGEATLANDKEEAMINAVMSPADRRDKLTMSVIVSNLGDRISNREALRLLGYSPERIDEIMSEIEEETKQGIQNASIAFSRGNAPGTQLPGSGPGGRGAQGGIGPGNPAPGATRNQETN